METIEITKSNAKKAYNEATGEAKKAILNLVGSKNLDLKLTDRLNSFEDCCKELGIDPDEVVPFKNPCNKDQISINAYAKLIVIINAHREGWEPDWENSNQEKSLPWFEYKTTHSGFCFSYADCHRWGKDTIVAARLYLPTSELAISVGKKFESIYNEYL